MKNTLIIILTLISLQYASAQDLTPKGGINSLEKDQAILEQTHPHQFELKTIQSLEQIDNNHSMVTYTNDNGLKTQDLIYDNDGEYMVIANFKEVSPVDMPNIVIDAYKRNYGSAVSSYYIVSPVIEGGNYFAVRSGKKYTYFSKMGHEMKAPR